MQRKLPRLKIKQKSSDNFVISNYFSRLKRKYKLKKDKNAAENNQDDYQNDYQKENEERKLNIENQKYLIKIYESNYQSLFDRIKKEYDEQKYQAQTDNLEVGNKKLPKLHISYSTKKDKTGFEQFNATKYVNQSCMKEFFNKYSKYDHLSRQYSLNNLTPSWAFIKSCKEEKIVPNPLGLLSRFGDEKNLAMTNHKVGDSYMKALSNSLKYSQHLSKLELSGNRMTFIGTASLFKSLNINKELAYNLRSIDLSYNKIGKNNIDELILFIQDSKCNVEDLNLFGNNIDDENIIKICDNLATCIEYKLVNLNLGRNNIHDICTNSICQMIKKCSGLRVLNLSHNWLHNQSAAKIITELGNNYELRMLDLSWNIIGDDLTAIPSYEQLVNSEYTHPERQFNNFSMNEALYTGRLNLRTNPLLPPLEMGGQKKQDNKKTTKVAVTAPTFREPKKIKEKMKDPSPFAIALGDYFSKIQLSLVHLDISHNNINYPDCKLIADKSKANHIILGMHVDGNAMDIDCLGFISPIEKVDRDPKYFCSSHISYGMNKDYNLRKTKVDPVRKIRGRNNCWICEGYREIEFEYIPEEPIGDPNSHLVKLHLDFDGYKPFDMIYNGNKYQIIRMCPPGEVNFFFTVDTIPVKKESPSGNNKFHTIENKHDYIKYEFDSEYMEELNNIKEKLLYDKKIREEGKEKGEEEKNAQNEDKSGNEENNTVKKFDLTSINEKRISIVVDTISTVQVKINRNVINEDYRKTLAFSEPRPEKIINKFVRPRTPWSYPISIWAYYDYEYDDIPDSYLDKCFEFDFNRCQFNKEFKDEESYYALRSFLRERYRDIIDCYKYYASYSGCQIWQITQNSLTEFINKCPGMCDKTYDINNVFLQQKVVVGNLVDKEDRKKKNKNLGENVVRHQFMNLLVKSAKDKYVTVLKTTKNTLEAVKMAFELHFDEAIKGFEYHKWRKERYYNEQVDNFLKTFLPILDGVYLSWAKQKGPTKRDIWMVFDEFNSLIQSFIDINEYPIRDNPYIFNQSLTIQINEIYTDKHLNMLLPEFLEALCRAVDKASPIPPGENKDEWPLSRRQAQPLINKLENILPVLIKLITHPDLKNLREKFPMPLKDLTTGLYVPNFESPFYQGYIIKPGIKKKEKPAASVANNAPTNDNPDKNQDNINLNDGGDINNEENKKIDDINVEKKEENEEEEKKEKEEKEEKEEKDQNDANNENENKNEIEENNNENQVEDNKEEEKIEEKDKLDNINNTNNEEIINTANTDGNAQKETSA